MSVFVHPTAVVDQPSQIGDGTKIWHFCHIMPGARIGARCNLGQNAFVASGVTIGDNCKIQNNVSLYDGVVLEEDVFCGPSMVFTNVKNPRSAIVRRGEYQATHVERGVTIGANATIVCGTRLGRFAFVAAGAVVTHDAAAYALLAGVPARRIGWAGRAGYELAASPDEPGLYICPGTGERYRLAGDDQLELIEAGEGSDLPPAPIPLLDLKRQHATIAAEVDAALRRVVHSQGFILGPEVEAFEREAAAAIGTPHAIACASGSDALLLALLALGLEPGDEVITTPYSFFATAGSIVRLGLRPVFCDIEPAGFNLDAGALERAITPRTRAIMPVHLFGQCAEMAPILEIARARGLAVIEDAAQAIGARYRGAQAGTMGTVGCFSFFPSRNLGGWGDGGLMTTRDGELAARLRSLRVHGSTERYRHRWVGVNSRLDALQAAVLRAKLPHLEGWSAARAAHATQYRQLFAAAGLLRATEAAASAPPHAPPTATTDAPGLIPPAVMQERHVFNQYVIRVAAGLRDPLRAWLTARGIGTAIYYPLPLHLQPCFDTLGHKEADFPEAERASLETLALPIFPELTSTEQERVALAIREFMDEHRTGARPGAGS